MGRSIVVEVRKAVIEGLADLLPPEVSCTYGWMGSDESAQRKQVFTARPRGTHEPASLRAGRNHRTEEMDFDVMVLVADPTSSAEEVDEQVMEIGEVVETFVADHKSNELDIPGLNWLIVTGFELDNRISATGAATVAQYTVRYNARLT